jgi:hypothetical protein
MHESHQHLLDELERDAGTEAAEAFSRLVVAYFASTREGDGRVSTARPPSELAARFGEPLPEHGRPLVDVLSRLERDVLPDVNRLSHPRAMGHQVSAPLAVAVWTEALTAALNQSAAVWEMSPVGTIVETQVVRWMCGLAGFGPDAGARSPRAARRPPSPVSSRRDTRRGRPSRGGVWALILRSSCGASTRTTQWHARSHSLGLAPTESLSCRRVTSTWTS